MEQLRLFEDGRALAASIGYNADDLRGIIDDRTLYVKVLVQKIVDLTGDPLVIVSEDDFGRAEARDIGWNYQDDGLSIGLILSPELDKSELA